MVSFLVLLIAHLVINSASFQHEYCFGKIKYTTIFWPERSNVGQLVTSVHFFFVVQCGKKKRKKSRSETPPLSYYLSYVSASKGFCERHSNEYLMHVIQVSNLLGPGAFCRRSCLDAGWARRLEKKRFMSMKNQGF